MEERRIVEEIRRIPFSKIKKGMRIRLLDSEEDYVLYDGHIELLALSDPEVLKDGLLSVECEPYTRPDRNPSYRDFLRRLINALEKKGVDSDDEKVISVLEVIIDLLR
jgi:hypothetical protein